MLTFDAPSYALAVDPIIHASMGILEYALNSLQDLAIVIFPPDSLCGMVTSQMTRFLFMVWRWYAAEAPEQGDPSGSKQPPVDSDL